jgi:hypothetical protein
LKKKLVSLIFGVTLALGSLVGSHSTEAATTYTKLTTLNSQGKAIYVTVPANSKVTKVDANYYKAPRTFTTYIKSGSKWVKAKKTTDMYVSSKYVRYGTTTRITCQAWIKGTSTPSKPPVQSGYANVILQLDSAKVNRVIKANAQANWGTDYEMIAYEIEESTTAYNQLKSMKLTRKPQENILKQAFAEWGYDFEMVQYQYQNQWAAYQKLH